MRGLEIIVLAIIAVCALVGYYRGFLRAVYSIVAWFVVLIFVTFATPHLTDFLEQNTGMKEAIQIKCINYMESMAQEKITQGAQEYDIGENSMIPDSIMEEIAGSAAAAIGSMLESSGLYEEIAEKIAHFIIGGISFFVIMAVVSMITFWIFRILNLTAKIPVIKGPDKLLGAIVGGLKGLIIVWIIFCILSLGSAVGIGEESLAYIKESPFLKLLYDNNLLLLILLAFIKK